MSFTRFPTTHHKGNVFLWSDVEVRYDETKQWGLYAKRILHAGLCFPYGGIVIDSREANNLVKSSTRILADGTRSNRADYLLHVPSSDVYLDAHPSRYGNSYPKHGWIGSYVNEPSITERANAMISCLSESDFPRCTKTGQCQQYPSISHNEAAYIQLAVDVEKGEEITAVYGYTPTAHKKLGYQVGYDCFEPIATQPQTSSYSRQPIIYYGKHKNRTAKQHKSSLRNIKKHNHQQAQKNATTSKTCKTK